MFNFTNEIIIILIYFLKKFRERYKEGTGKKTDLLDYLLLESNKLPSDQQLSHAEINSILMDILGAGHDTVSTVII